jgi:glycosyltransferase involved in cell wall biosynthesis
VTALTVAVDATPLIGVRTGIGRYVEHLVRELATGPDEIRLVLSGITARRGSAIPRDPAWQVVTRPFPARGAQALWRRGIPLPAAEWFAGRHDVFHGTNFVLPPSRRAAGVVTVHDLAWLLLPGTVAPATAALRELVPRGLRRAALVLVPSQAVADLLQEHLQVPPDRIRVTPLGVDESWLSAVPDARVAQRLGLPERYVAVVATQEPRKNLPFLLAAHREASLADPATPALVLMGGQGWGGPLGPPSDRVLQTGYLPQEELRRVVAGACALALPSLDEGFGLPVLEAFATGVPVLASDLPVLREVSGGLASFADARDMQAWAALLADPPSPDPSRLRAWAASATWRRCARTTAAAYRDAARLRIRP